MACIDHQQTLPTVNPPNYPGVQYQNAPYSDHINSVQFHTLPPAISAVAFPASAPPSNGNRMSKKKKYFFIALLILVLLVIIISLILIAVRIENAEKDLRWRQPETSCYGFYTSDAPIRNIGIWKEIDMPGSDTKLNVYCDGSVGSGWIVIQYRAGPEFFGMGLSFEKQWSSYEQGFGDETGYWIGLKKLHELTSSTDYELRIDMEDYCGSTAHATYSNFKIGGADEKYKLTVSGYSGNSTDSLSSSNGNVFSISSSNYFCTASGGWWFSDNYFSCRDTNLNGKLYSFYDIHGYNSNCYYWRHCDCVSNGYNYWESNFNLGSYWDGFGGGSNLIKATKMRIRPKFI